MFPSVGKESGKTNIATDATQKRLNYTHLSNKVNNLVHAPVASASTESSVIDSLKSLFVVVCRIN
jgi:hypothetical protein